MSVPVVPHAHVRTHAHTHTKAARHFGVTALRDVTSQELLQRASELDPDTLRRARHVVTGPGLLVHPPPLMLPRSPQ